MSASGASSRAPESGHETTDAGEEGGRQVEECDDVDPDPHGDKSSDSVQEDVEAFEPWLEVPHRLDERGVPDGEEGTGLASVINLFHFFFGRCFLSVCRDRRERKASVSESRDEKEREEAKQQKDCEVDHAVL